jgi:hypothetical protein
MTLLVPNVGEGRILGALLNKTAPENLTLKLYVNDVSPAEAHTASNYTAASGFGYADKTLTGSAWTITEGDPTYALYAEQVFGFTGALGNVYGYFVVQASSGVLMWAERFTGAPLPVGADGDQIKVTPRIELA